MGVEVRSVSGSRRWGSKFPSSSPWELRPEKTSPCKATSVGLMVGEWASALWGKQSPKEAPQNCSQFRALRNPDQGGKGTATLFPGSVSPHFWRAKGTSSPPSAQLPLVALNFPPTSFRSSGPVLPPVSSPLGTKDRTPPPPWSLSLMPPHPSDPTLNVSSTHSRTHTPAQPGSPVPALLTGRQGEEAERQDGAVHAVALPPRAGPHHCPHAGLQLAQQRLPAPPRQLHGLRGTWRAQRTRESGSRLERAGGGPGRSHPPGVTVRAWHPSASRDARLRPSAIWGHPSAALRITAGGTRRCPGRRVGRRTSRAQG